MVHALHEAHRVLKSNGVLIDLRPTPRHRRVGMARPGGEWQLVGVMREKFDADRAANRAVAQVLREGLFRRVESITLDLPRVMDTLDDFREWLDGFDDLPPHDWLVQRLARALQQQLPKTKIVVRGPLQLRVMERRG